MSEKIYLVRFFVPQQGIKIGVQKDDIIYTLNHEKATSIASLLDASIGRVDDFWDELLNSTDAQSYIASDLENPPNDNQLHATTHPCLCSNLLLCRIVPPSLIVV